MSSSKGSINHCTVNPILEAFILELSLPRKPADGRSVAHKPERTHPHVCGGMADEPCNTGNHCAPYRAAVTNPPLHDYQVQVVDEDREQETEHETDNHPLPNDHVDSDEERDQGDHETDNHTLLNDHVYGEKEQGTDQSTLDRQPSIAK